MRPWYPWYPADYESDTKFLSDTADLMYRRLIDQYWMNSGPLPMNYRLLGRAINMDQRVVKRYLTTELSGHFACLCGTCGYTYAELVPLSPPQVCPTCSARHVILFNKRIQAELEISKEKHELAKKAGRMGGLAKAKANAIANALASHTHTHNIPTTTPHSPTLEHSQRKPKKPKNGTARMKKPTIDEIQTYIDEHHYSVNAQSFFSHYESNGWKVGKNPMKNWKAALAGWNSRESKRGNHHARPQSAVEAVEQANGQPPRVIDI